MTLSCSSLLAQILIAERRRCGANRARDKPGQHDGDWSALHCESLSDGRDVVENRVTVRVIAKLVDFVEEENAHAGLATLHHEAEQGAQGGGGSERGDASTSVNIS